MILDHDDGRVDQAFSSVSIVWTGKSYHVSNGMYHSIQQVLGDRWIMLYHAAWPVSQLRPVCTLDQCIEQTNRNLRTLGRDLHGWPPGDQDQAARLLWVNWIYKRLPVEPIRKPVLAHRMGNDIVVDCGDTRLMALSLLTDPATVGVIVTDRKEQIESWPGWIQIQTDQELLFHAGFAPHAEIVCRAAQGDHAIDWLEIGDQSTSHHLHDVDLRVRMLENYLKRQEQDFQFDSTWARSPIDWTTYLADH